MAKKETTTDTGIKIGRKVNLSFKLSGVSKKTSKIVGALLLVIILGLAAYNFKGLLVAAVVNGHPITRYSLDKQLEKQGGKQILDSEITKFLILQEAKRQKLTISQTEIDDKIKGIEKQLEGQQTTLDAALQAQGETRESLKEQIRVQLIIEKILGKDISVSDKEISDSFEQKKSTLPKGTTLDSVKDDLKNELFQQKMGEKFQPWITDLRQKAKIYYFLNL